MTARRKFKFCIEVGFHATADKNQLSRVAMKRFAYTLLFLSVFIAACSRKGKTSKVVCGVTDPAGNLPWLSRHIDSLKSLNQTGYVASTNSGGKDYINIQLAVLSCRPCDLYTCEGRRLQFPSDSALIATVSKSQSFEVLAAF